MVQNVTETVLLTEYVIQLLVLDLLVPSYVLQCCWRCCQTGDLDLCQPRGILSFAEGFVNGRFDRRLQECCQLPFTWRWIPETHRTGVDRENQLCHYLEYSSREH